MGVGGKVSPTKQQRRESGTDFSAAVNTRGIFRAVKRKLVFRLKDMGTFSDIRGLRKHAFPETKLLRGREIPFN